VLAGLVIATIGLGLAHVTDLGTGAGLGTSMWWHVVTAVASLPLLAWHVTTRPVRPRRTDVDRRQLLALGVRTVGAGAAVAAIEVAARVTDRRPRRFSGSHEIASFDPASLPAVSWLDDVAPRIDPAEWRLAAGGAVRTLEELIALAAPIIADLDCTGGWWSRQRWDAVALVDLLDPDDLEGARSIEIVSATGFRRHVPVADADRMFLAVGYDGAPLRRGHGAPARLVAPGRRGPWWVKWVVEIRPSTRPWWWQLPLPVT
jgi:DMSO/TMAO reductase YedYZ molybdopterin-dependent catalytic subunit